VHVADRIAHHPDISDPRSPELHLNYSYLERHDRGACWNQWRELCAGALAEAQTAQGRPS
jgi:hypothetical protein